MDGLMLLSMRTGSGLIAGLMALLVCNLNAQLGSRHEILPGYRDEILEVTGDDRLISAFALIMEDVNTMRSQLIELTEIPAPPFKEKLRAKKFAGLLQEAGVDSLWIDQVGNVLALRKGHSGRNRLVALDAHLDTVFPEGTDVRVEVRGDTLFAPGIGDDTRGLAMLLSIVRALNAAEIETEADILFVGSVGEEGIGDLRGVKHIFREDGPGVDAWISIDGGAIGRISNQGLGSYRYRVTFIGPGGHSWGAFGLVNPHHALGSAIDHFIEAADAFTSHGVKTSYNVGRIGGGTSVNSIPFSSWMEVDMRSVSPARLDSMDALLKNAVMMALDEQNALLRLGDSLRVEIEMIGNRPSGELPSDLPLVQRAMVASAFLGKRPGLTRGSTNSNIPISMGIPAVTIGRGGRGAHVHSLNEWWMVGDSYKATQFGLLLLVTESGLVPD
jgi:tripeptide aminopeptidase